MSEPEQELLFKVVYQKNESLGRGFIRECGNSAISFKSKGRQGEKVLIGSHQQLTKKIEEKESTFHNVLIQSN